MIQPPQPPTPQPIMLNYAAPVRNDLRLIASRQKGIMYCVLSYFICIALRLFAFGSGNLVIEAAVGVLAVATVITGAVFVFALAIALYGTGAGIALGICTLIPLVGLIILLIVNGKATTVLRRHGVRVGLMGARMSDVPVAPGPL